MLLRTTGRSLHGEHFLIAGVKHRVRRVLRRGRYRWHQVIGREPWFRRDRSVAMVELGEGDGKWRLSLAYLPASGAVVYSFGVGDNLSFELGLADRVAADIRIFDPTPRSIRWLEGVSLPESIRFLPVGIADCDGTADFTLPAGHSVSYTAGASVVNDGSEEPVVTGEVARLETLRERLGHERIDVLKLDVEGSEYAVIEDFLASGVRPDQILVEFHHRFTSHDAEDTRRAVARLRGAGYALIDVFYDDMNYVFLRSQHNAPRSTTGAP